MFRHACAFAECADLAKDRICHGAADIEWYATPAIVNSAFACEVFLKALLIFYDVPFKKEHELKELYEFLPEDTRIWIKLAVMSNYGGIWTDILGRELLESISNAFVNWRYWYEFIPQKTSSMQIDVGFLEMFRNTLRDACKQLFFQGEMGTV